MSDGPKTLGALLSSLTPRGVYDVAIIEEQMTRFGFSYNRATDMLTYKGRKVRLFAGSPEDIARSMASDPKGGVLDEGMTRAHRLVDANTLSGAIYRLLFPGQEPPSEGFYGRSKGFKADVDAIVASEKLN